MQVLVHCIATGKYDSIEQHNVTGHEVGDLSFAERHAKPDHLPCRQLRLRYSFLALELVRSGLQPLDHVALQVENSTASTICPAHVGDRHKEQRRQAVQFPDLAATDRELSRKAHWPD